jgi:Protein of unknown function (DUF2568)
MSQRSTRRSGDRQPRRLGSGNDQTVNAARAANLALKFVLELAALAAFATWGASVDGTGVAVLLGVGIPVVLVALWSRFAAPKSPRRLPTTARIPFELAVFALAAVSLFAAGHTSLAIAFSAAVVVNAVLLTWFQQWDR